MKKIFISLGGIGALALAAISFTLAYTQEEREAYQWAYQYGITTQSTIDDAKLDGNITRQAFAKMVVNYLENVVGIDQTNSSNCTFPDENKITSDLLPYVKKACSYGIMGKDGTIFNPTQPLNKAQLGTVLSRIIWGGSYDNTGKGYYIYHLNALKFNGIMDNIDKPTESYIKRGDVLIMFKRINDKFSSNTNINNTNTGLKNEDIILNGEKIVYYGSGKIAVKMNFKNGKEDGIWESYYENGQLQKKNFYKNGEKDGEQFEYYENGQLMSKENYKDGEPDGDWVEYYENGQLLARGYFKNGELDGEFVAYYGDGRLESKGNYKHGQKDGEQLEYYENEQLKSKENYKDGEPDGEFVAYYGNGKLEAKGNYKDGRPDGEFVAYYENGELEDKGYFKDGEPDGEFVAYYGNGKLEAKGNYKDGRPDGEWIAYYESGQLKEKNNYKNGEFDGEIIAYYENGKLKAKGNYKDGKEDGKLIYYYDDGQLSLEINFKDGLFDGKYTHHFKDGKITEMNYKNGKEDGKQIGYYEDGSIRFLHNFKDGFGTKSYFDKEGNVIGTGTEMFTNEMDEDGGFYKSILNGLEILYYENGQPREISNYKDGELDGTRTSYYENGQVSFICSYVNGIVSGDCTMYNVDGEEITLYLDNYSSILPDSAEITIADEVIMGEATNLKITIMKNGSKMSNYQGIILMFITDENGIPLKENEFTLPSNGIYQFLGSDLGTKEFQRGLEIKKEGKFYIEVQDLNDNEDKVLGRELITVIKS